MNVLVIDRQLPFAEIAARLSADGWRLEEDATAPTPLIEGEPEIVMFQRADSQLHYRFEPATGLRELRVSGPRAVDDLAALSAQFPNQGEHARELLRDSNAKSRLLGLQMATSLNRHDLLEEVASLMSDADATVSHQAARAFTELLAAPTELALQSLAQWKSANPGKSAVLLFAGSSHRKLQILRWWARDRQTSNEHIDEALRTAFEDADWEVRLTALVVAARLRACDLLDEALRLRLPEDTADGVNVDERRMLRTIQLCAIELLQGAAVPPQADVPPNTREAMHDHLLRCLAGAPVLFQEKAFLYVTSLATPLPDEAPAPAKLPVGIAAAKGAYVLEELGLELCWVPPVPHWLGEELPRMQIENPIRRELSKGYFISRGLGASAAHPEPFGCSYEAALEHCRRIGDATKLNVRLPTANEWEMAARGPDARRFPWGNNARGAARFGESPWGVIDAVGRVGQWTGTSHGDGMLVCGGPKQWVCAMRVAANRRETHAARFVIEV